MDYDRILTQLGEFGTWQKRNYFLLWLPTLAAGINIMTAAWSVMTPRKGNSSVKCSQRHNKMPFGVKSLILSQS